MKSFFLCKKHLANDSTILGQDLAWTYDDIGNRSSASRNASSAETLVREDYTPNALNQYASRTLPAIAEAFGTAASDAVVTVNAQPTQRQGGNWYASLPYANAYEGTWVDLAIKGVRAGAGPGGTDAVANGVRHLWLPKSPEIYTYDADGNLTADGRWSYAWDAENRLAAMETRADLLPPVGLFPLAQKRRVEFGYDGQSRRVSKKVFNWSPGGWVLAQSNRFLYEGWNLIAELNQPLGTSNLILGASFTWGLDLSGSIQGAGGVGGLLFSTFSTQPSTYASAYDGNGNVIGLVDMATGTKSATYDYNAFGETIQSDGVASITNHFRFSTKYTDDETGLLYYGFRYYNTSTGRWLSKDPIAEAGGVNLYGYCTNDATNFVDTDGRQAMPTTTSLGTKEGILVLWVLTHPNGPDAPQNCLTCGNSTFPTPAPTLVPIPPAPNPAPKPPNITVGPSLKYTPEEEAEQLQERKEYHRVCDQLPPSELKDCNLWRWKLKRAEECVKLRQGYVDKWKDTYPGHQQQIQLRLQEIQKLKERIAKECQPCPTK